MKWITTFLIGALVGAIGSFVYLRSIAPDPAPVAASFSAIATPASPGLAIAPVTMPAPSAIVKLPADLAAAPESAAAATVSVADQLLIPVAGISASQLNDTFNETRGDDRRRHEALDIEAPKGTQVFAVADGKVAKLFDSKPGGLTAYQFDTSEKFAYYYAHLDRYAAGVKEGTVLKRGDLVGYVGTTGNADPATPHLHFAIFELGPEKQWWKGTPINPYPLLGGAKRP
jgi:murein DD-endopeptidase MepM/ murein hydrolase activator NlpD